MDTHAENRGITLSRRYAWPAEGLTRIPDWVYTDPWIYEREVERIFKGRTWNYVALESEIPNSGDYIRSAADFKAAVEGAGYECRKTKTGAFWFGLRLTSEFAPVVPCDGRDYMAGDGR